MGLDLARQRADGEVNRVVFLDAGAGGVDVRLLHQQRDPTAQLPLDGPGRGGDAVADVMFVQQVVQGQTLLIVGKEDIPAGDLSH